MTQTGLFKNMKRRWVYAACGFVLGLFAPVGWQMVRLALFWKAGQSLWAQVGADVFGSVESVALYSYMGGGTAVVLGAFGYFIGKSYQQMHERALRLDELNQAVALQKEEFERRFCDLNADLKNFHGISAKMQQSVDGQEVLRLAADGLHEALGYDRVTVLLADADRQHLQCVEVRGEGCAEGEGAKFPLDATAGAVYQAVSENRLLMVDAQSAAQGVSPLRGAWEKVLQLHSQCYILCPVRLQHEVIGVIGIDNAQSGKRLDDTDLDTIKLFGDQVSSCLTRINLIDAVGTLTTELEGTFQELLKFRSEHQDQDRSLKEATLSTTDTIQDFVNAAGVVRESVDSTRSSAGEISVSIDQVSQNLHRLNDFMDNSISVMTEISAAIKSVEESGEQSHQLSERVKFAAEQGESSVSGVLTGLGGISRAVEGVVGAIGRLSEKSEEIDSITVVSNEIAQKTNLLALNAAIIAAQAGEHGRSFAVVADEVRSLSQEAATATDAIAKSINEIQEFTRQTVEHVSSTRKLVAEGITLGEAMAGSLREIVESAEPAMAMAKEIRKATKEVSRSVESVSVSIEELGEMASQVSVASREQAQGTRNIVQSIDEVKDMADDMFVATEKQQRNTAAIEKAVSSVSEMVTRIFDEMEQRQQGGREVLERLEGLRGANR